MIQFFFYENFMIFYNQLNIFNKSNISIIKNTKNKTFEHKNRFLLKKITNFGNS